MKSNAILKSILFVSALVLLTSCADSVMVDSCLSGDTYGFWSGLWHGFISPFAFIISIFDDEVAIYAINNSGTLYDLGFLLGAGAILGSGSRAV